MIPERSLIEDFEHLLTRFSNFIRIHIQKFNVQKFGIDPDDIAQEVRIKIWKLLKSEKNIVSYPSYIKKIVDSSVIDQIRKLRREELIFSQEKQKHIAEYEKMYQPEALKYSPFRDLIGHAVESLILSRKNVVKLYLLNMSIEEIARYFNWSLPKTRNLLYRGLSDLKKSLKRMDIDYENQ